MRIKKYVAASMPEALKLVKADLGPKAVILNTRSVKKSAGLGLLAKGQIEVTAAIDDPAPRSRRGDGSKSASSNQKSRPDDKAGTGARVAPGADAETPSKRQRPPRRDTRAATADRSEKPARKPGRGPGPQRQWASSAGSQPAAAAPQVDTAWANRLSQQITDLQSALQVSRPSAANRLLPGALKTLAVQMDEAGLLPELAEEILDDILLDPGEAGFRSLPPLQTRAAAMLAAHTGPGAPTQVSDKVRSVVALVGPAGSGKTTAAARIAAEVSTTQGKRAAFIAADTDRVGGLEQLRAYAAILSLPVDVVRSPDDMVQAVRERRDVDLLIVDTAGAGPSSADELERLEDLIKEAGPSEVHLVLGAATGLPQMMDAVAAYRSIGADRLLLTKLDETDRLGAACTLAIRAGLPLSYTTDGRDVPGNLSPGDPGQLCRAVFSRRPDAAD